MSRSRKEEKPATVTDFWDWPHQGRDGVVRITNTKDVFEVALEVHFFTPQEVKVAIMPINKLVIDCSHDVKDGDYSSIKRELHRMYQLPADIDLSTLESTMNSKGILHIKGSKSGGQLKN